jgi:hypothetical protein
MWRGKWVARAWPRKPAMPRSPAVQAQNARLAQAAYVVKRMEQIDIDNCREQSGRTNWTWRDYAMSYCMGKGLKF